MKNISRSLAVIAGAAAIAIGGTYALFFDTEIAENNTVTAGTIDIQIGDSDPWTGNYSIPDIKPGETKYIEFNVKNVGQNPVNLSKKIYGMEGTGGTETYACAGLTPPGSDKTSSEPECEAEKANSNMRVDTIQTQIVYDLSVEVYADENLNDKIWWQTIYSEGEGKKLTNVYDGSNSVNLGMLPVGATMKVKQSYHFDAGADNKYQGDQLKFDMEIRGDQLPQGTDGQATVTLENKGGAPDWNINETDDINGTLTYKTAGSVFDYSLKARVNTTADYSLVYVGPTGDYPGENSKFLGKANFTAGSEIIMSNSIDINTDISGGKIWLVPSSTYNSGNSADGQFTSWDHVNNLYETGLVDYDDTDVVTP